VEVHHSSGLHVAAVVSCGASAKSFGFQVSGMQAGRQMAVHCHHCLSMELGVVGGVVMGMSSERQASVVVAA
jgi:hypothetical protein